MMSYLKKKKITVEDKNWVNVGGNNPKPLPGPGIPPALTHILCARPRASSPDDGRLGHPLLHMQLWGGVLVSSYCCSSHRVADPFSSLGTFPSSFIRGSMFHSIDDCEHPFLYLLGIGMASQERGMSGSCQLNLSGICNSVCVSWLIMRWIAWWGSFWMVLPFVLAPNFVSVTPSMGVLFPILRRNEVSPRWSSFLIFLFFCKFYLGHSKILG